MFFYKLIVLLVYALTDIPQVIGLKCYACGEQNSFLGAEYRKPLPCKQMDHQSHDLADFIIDCPQEYFGCITQRNAGKEMMRTCDLLAIDDCETANSIQYCYCSQDLCNYSKTKSQNSDARLSSRDILTNYPSDDEDYGDALDLGNSSGMGRQDVDVDDDNDDFKQDTNNRDIEMVLYKNNSSRHISNTIVYKFIIITIVFNFLRSILK